MRELVFYAIGALLLALGVLGFLGSSLVAPLGVDHGHDSIHVLSGLAVLGAVYFWPARIVLFAKILGVLYALLAILGFFTLANDALMQIFNLNLAHTVVHIALAAIFLYFGFFAAGNRLSGALR
jgi:hypothetical protein